MTTQQVKEKEATGKTRQEFLTFCFICAVKCSRKVIVEDGKIVAIERDLESGLPTEWCPSAKGQYVPEIYYSPKRLMHPLKRAGARGEGKWEQISWDEALDTIATKFNEIRNKYGPEYIAMLLGEPKGMEINVGYRFATMLGTPNVATPGHVCAQPTVMASAFTFGQIARWDNVINPKLVVLWGNDPVNTVVNGMHRDQLRSTLLAGAKLIVIDPKKIDIAKRADLWIRPRPLSDGVLALGVVKIMIEEGWYDKDFVANWTVGFDEIKKEIKNFTLDDVEKVTWVPKEQIRQLAQMCWEIYPASIQDGNAWSQSINALQNGRAMNIIRVLTGKINTPGTDIFYTAAPLMKLGHFVFPKSIPNRRKIEVMIGQEYQLAKIGNYMPTEPLIKAILTGKPYAPKAAMYVLTNPLSSYGNSTETYEALMKLDFLVGSDIFHTPTTLISDIVLPAAWGSEQETMEFHLGGMGAHPLPKIIDPPGEARPDPQWMNDLGKRMGLPGFWDDEQKVLDAMVEPAGLTWEQFKAQRGVHGEREYKKPEDGIFKTPSGKCEIYSERLKEMGYSPMPTFKESSHFRYALSEKYPLLMTNAKEPYYYLTGYKQVDGYREKSPWPLVEMHPDTAEKAGLKEGDWAYIENKNGKIQQKVLLNSDLDPRVIIAAFGWWFPEEKEDLYAFRKSNINVLTDNDEPRDPQIGSPEFRGIPVRISKV